MPYYRCYETSDGRFMAVGCIEPQFFAEFLRLLEIDPTEFGGQNKRDLHETQHATLEALFKTQTRDHWAALFDGSDACTSPVLDYVEAAQHPQVAARHGLTPVGPFTHPRPAPVFGEAGEPDLADIPRINAGREAVTALLGYDEDRVAQLITSKVLSE